MNTTAANTVPSHGAASQEKMAEAVAALRVWQAGQDRRGANRHGRCLEATRAALTSMGLSLPPPQPRPRNLALSNYGMLREGPARWGWAPAPAGARYTLDYFDHVGRLPDGRIAGHIAIADHAAGVLYSSWDYPLDRYWLSVRVGSFVPLAEAVDADNGGGGSAPAPHSALAHSLDLDVEDGGSGTRLVHIPACVLLAKDGHAYVRATALAEATGVPYTLNDPHRDGRLILRRGPTPAGQP